MSHYCVAVFANSPEDVPVLLAPFDECDEKLFRWIPYEGGEKRLRERYEKSTWENKGTFDEWVMVQGLECQNGEYGYRGNPNAKWDWYRLGNGAHWGFFPKEGAKTYEYSIARKDQYEYWENDEETGEPHPLVPYAFITPDGVWHAPGTVGWFATDDSTDESQTKYDEEWAAYIASDENPWVCFADCHI